MFHQALHRSLTLRPTAQRLFSAALALGICGACLGAGAPEARAQARTEDRVAAESLFAEARRLMQSRDYEQACAKLEASRRLEPALGTTLNLAACYERLGRTASAWAEFKSAAAEAQRVGDAARKSAAAEHAAALEPRLCRLQIDVDEPGVSVLRNGEPLSVEVLGNGIPVDPGSYRLVARAPGKLTWEQTVEVSAEGQLVEVRIPALASSITSPEPTAAPDPPPVADAASDAQRTWAWALGGVGVASLAVGTTFGLLASSSWSEAEEGCANPPNGCDPDSVNQSDRAGTQADVATAAFVVGGAALGTSLLLFLTDSEEPPSTTLAITPSQLSLKGRF